MSQPIRTFVATFSEVRQALQRIELNRRTGVQNNFTATSAPEVGDDEVDGYSAGSFWFDTVADMIWLCTDATTGAAVWVNLFGSGGVAGTGHNFATVNPSSGTAVTASSKGDTVNLTGSGVTVTGDGTDTITIAGAAASHTHDHTADLTNVGTNTHAQIDSHIADTTDPHGASMEVSTQIKTPTIWNEGDLALGPSNAAADTWCDLFNISPGFVAHFSVDGSIVVGGTVDGRDVDTDGTKLDGIAANANNYTHPNHSGEVTSVADGATTIANDAVTYAKMQNVSATDKVLGRVTAGAGDVEEIACTAAGRAILDDANAAAQRTTLGLVIGTDVLANIVEDTSPELGGEMDAGAHTIGFTQQTATGDGTTTFDWTVGNKFKFTFGAQNETFTFDPAPSNPCNLVLMLVQDGTGGRTVTWPGTVKWVNSTAPTLSTGANDIDIVAFYYDGTNYYGATLQDFG